MSRANRVRNLATHYPYDTQEDGQLSLRGDTEEVAGQLQAEIQGRLTEAGVEVLEARITHLAYAPEIASAMLQRQQAGAIIATRTQMRAVSDTEEVAGQLQAEIQGRLTEAGVEVLEARITHLAYAPEIASAMLQRQQAGAIIATRTQIVEGAVSMVQMALDQLSARNVVELDEERKAAMVSNLLVVLCGDRSTQPVLNTDSFNH